MQETVERTPDVGYAGAIASGAYKVLGRRAQEDIEFGEAVVESTDGESIRKPLLNSLTITSSADYATSNSFDGSIAYRKVGETDFTEVALTAVVYATSHAATIAAIAAQILTDVTSTVLQAPVVSAADKTIQLLAQEGYEIKEGTTAIAVTGGTPPTITLTQASTDVIMGLAKFLHKEHTSLTAEDAKWKAGDMVPVMTQGTMWVKTEVAATTGSSPYARIQDTTGYNRGAIRTSVGSPVVGLSFSGRFRGSADAAGLVKLELNQP
ncbi:MAG: hypothetical protein IV090_24605 [Candidatus Sericytochromatia bacterium]|nr:hypothetical protein [Candidatus Sericytochromatia bacterium]